ncbi:MAG TPA: hypothetical protein VMW38_00760 [Terriglobia bacterium]|nr:hypothetical protein [Terriglobia bacterium]
MKRNLLLALIAALVLASVGIAQTQTRGPWMHLEVTEKGGDPGTIKVNLPVSMVDTALNMVKDKNLKEGHLKLDHTEISVVEMRQLWNELKNAGNAEFVSVEKKDETVRISREGSFVLIKVNNTKNTEKVDIRMPISVVDALLSGQENELNLKAALSSMKVGNAGDILTVNEPDTHVRLWID